MGQVNFLTQLRDYDGDVVMTANPKSKSDADRTMPLTLSHVCITALQVEDPEAQTVEAKRLRHRLAKKIKRRGTMFINAETTALLKKATARGWGPMICGQACELLDPSPDDDDDDREDKDDKSAASKNQPLQVKMELASSQPSAAPQTPTSTESQNTQPAT